MKIFNSEIEFLDRFIDEKFQYIYQLHMNRHDLFYRNVYKTGINIEIQNLFKEYLRNNCSNVDINKLKFSTETNLDFMSDLDIFTFQGVLTTDIYTYTVLHGIDVSPSAFEKNYFYYDNWDFCTHGYNHGIYVLLLNICESSKKVDMRHELDLPFNPNVYDLLKLRLKI